jgi:hypothetical protein
MRARSLILATALLLSVATLACADSLFENSKLSPGVVVQGTGFQSPKLSPGVVVQGTGFQLPKLSPGVVVQGDGLQSSKISVGIVLEEVAGGGGVVPRAPLTHW